MVIFFSAYFCTTAEGKPQFCKWSFKTELERKLALRRLAAELATGVEHERGDECTDAEREFVFLSKTDEVPDLISDGFEPKSPAIDAEQLALVLVESLEH